MARLVTKFKYLKPDQEKPIGGYATYIATREGVEKIDESFKLAPATVKQQKLIEKLLRDFPDSATMLEYEDYQREKTVGVASEFITRAIEDNAHEILNQRTYADYIGTRPGAERFGSHGMFTDDGVQVKLKEVSQELNAHQGNVWTLIISLRREDAECLGFNTGIRWRDMLRTQTQALADSLKIPMDHLKWYAAFHNESHHPHIHLLAYSTVENEGFLTKQGVAKMRSSLAKDIFEQDLLCIYEKQTVQRDELRLHSKELIVEIVSHINAGTYDNPKVEELLLRLADRLSKTKGKKVYGYLKADVKALVDAIVDELVADEKIAALYNLWYEQKEEALQVYTEALPQRVPLSQNKEFKPIKNAVIQEALGLHADRQDVEEPAQADAPDLEMPEAPEPDSQADDPIEPDLPPAFRSYSGGRGRKKDTWWTDEYKAARAFLYGTKTSKPDFEQALAALKKEALRGNGFAMHDLGKMVLAGLGCEKEEEQAQEWFRKAFSAFCAREPKEEKPGYLRYRIGKMYAFGYGVDQNYLKAAEWYEKSVAEGNPFVAYALGSLYHRGQGVDQDEEKAFDLFTMAATDENKPNAYAQYELLYYLDNFYETLVRYDNGEIIPGLAEKWEVSSDALTYTFTLKQGIKFSDGEELNAEVVKLNFDNMPAILGDSNGVFGLTSTLMDEVTVVDEYTVVVKLTTPYYGALQDFTLPLPMGIMSPNAFNEDGSLSESVKTQTMGSGPYMYNGQKENDVYTFVRNPYYDRGGPDVDIFHVKVIPDNDAKLLALRNGEVDMLLSANNMSYDAYQELSQDTSFGTLTSDAVIQTRILGINPVSQPFEDVEIRQAVNYAINKESICQNIFSGVEVPAESVMDPALPYCDIDTGSYHYSPEQAVKLLEDAGWLDVDGDGVREKDGVKLSTSISCSSDLAMLEDVTAAVAEDLKAVGFEVTTSSKETMTYYQDVNRGEYGIGIGITFNIPMDPFQFIANLRREPMRDNMVAQGLQSLPGSDALINSLYSMANDSNFDRNPLRGCNYGLEGGCSTLPKEEERLHEIMC